MGNSTSDSIESSSKEFQNLVVRIIGACAGFGFAAVWMIAALYHQFNADIKEANDNLADHVKVEAEKVELWEKNYEKHLSEFDDLVARVITLEVKNELNHKKPE